MDAIVNGSIQKERQAANGKSDEWDGDAHLSREGIVLSQYGSTVGTFFIILLVACFVMCGRLIFSFRLVDGRVEPRAS